MDFSFLELKLLKTKSRSKYVGKNETHPHVQRIINGCIGVSVITNPLALEMNI